jgi:3-hydroxy-3-methylglutaryl CoA synthase
MTAGILAYGAYLPHARLERKAIAEALGAPSGSGTRAVASYDEDTTSMAVEAARAVLRTPGTPAPATVCFATTAPPYLDKTNATAIHAALDLDPCVAAYDMAGAVRSGSAVLWAALGASRPTLAVAADVRTGLAGGADEREGGDGAVAFLCGPADGAIAHVLGSASVTREFLERWRLPARAPRGSGRSASASRCTCRSANARSARRSRGPASPPTASTGSSSPDRTPGRASAWPPPPA